MDEQGRVVAIEGNTGCGKTEVLHWLSTFPGVITCEVVKKLSSSYFLFITRQ